MKKIIISIIMLLFIGCDEVEATSKENITNKVMKSSIVEPVTEPIVLFLDDMSFTEAFAIEHRAKGEGHMFWWRGDQYTTNLAYLDEFVLEHINSNDSHLGWVTNNDDPDDNCKSNKIDECAVCDGTGKATWWRDKDGDGLGSFMEWITSCTYPTDTEIESYQAENLIEGGGDQGY